MLGQAGEYFAKNNSQPRRVRGPARLAQRIQLRQASVQIGPFLSQGFGPALSPHCATRSAKRRRAGQRMVTRESIVFKPAAPAALWLRSPNRCLTLRSSGPPPAWHLGREASQVIVRLAAQAPIRFRPLSSNVRPHAKCKAANGELRVATQRGDIWNLRFLLKDWPAGLYSQQRKPRFGTLRAAEPKAVSA